MSTSVKGFLVDNEIHKYDYESLDNKLQFDETLTQTGKIPDSKKVGDAITDLKADMSELTLSDEIKVALLNCFQNVHWIDSDGQTYYSALEMALYKRNMPSVTIVNNSSIGTDNETYCSKRDNLTARCRFEVPLKNNEYKIKIVDSAKYAGTIFNLASNTLETYEIDGAPRSGYRFGNGRYVSIADGGTSVTGEYFWCSFAKKDGTDFTTEEINNAYGTIYDAV